MTAHVLSVLVNNHSGVLNKVTGLFSRRCFNIDSLTVGESEDPKLSRMTIVASGDDLAIEQVKNQLAKLVDVVMVEELGDRASVKRELALVKVRATIDTRLHILEMTNIFRGRVVDVSEESLTAEVTGESDKIDSLIEMLRPFGLIETVRTGLIALDRGPRGLKEM